MLDWLFGKGRKETKTPQFVNDNKTLIHVNSKEAQKYVFDKYGEQVPLWSVYCTKDKFYNSSLWFEMWHPSKEYI